MALSLMNAFFAELVPVRSGQNGLPTRDDPFSVDAPELLFLVFCVLLLFLVIAFFEFLQRTHHMGRAADELESLALRFSHKRPTAAGEASPRVPPSGPP
jgi:hypothetical protein